MDQDDKSVFCAGSGAARSGHLIAVLAIITVVMLAYLPPILGGKVYYSQDTSDFNYVMLRSHLNDLFEHGFTWWCPEIGTGFLRAADPTYTLYSPRVLLFFLIRNYNAQIATILLYAAWAGIGGYVLGLALTRSRAASLYMGIVWPLSGVVISNLSNIPYLTAAAWLPWALASWMGVSRALPRIWASGLCTAMIAIDGDPIAAGLTLGVLAVISVLVPVSGSREKEAVAWTGSAIIFGGLTAVIWTAALAALPESLRAGGLNIYEASSFNLHPMRLLNLFAPSLWGQIHEQSFWGIELTSSLIGRGFWFKSVYLGLLAPLLGIAALVRPHPDRRRVLVLLMIAAVFIVLAFGPHTPVLPRLMYSFEWLKMFRFPAKFFTFSSIFILCAAGIGLREVGALLGKDRARGRAAVISVAVLAAVSAVIISYAASSADYINEVSPRPDQSFLRIKQDVARIMIFMAAAPAVLLVLGKRARLRPAAIPLIIVGVAALDMLSSLHAPPAEDVDDLYIESEVAADIRESGPGRLIAFDNPFGYSLLRIGPRTSARPNWGILDGLEYAFGKTETLPSRIWNLSNLGTFSEHGRGIFRVFAVNYVVSPIDPQEDWVRKLEVEGVIRELKRYPGHNLILYKAARNYPQVSVTRRVRLVSSRGHAVTMALQDGGFDANNPLVNISIDTAAFQGKMIAPPTPSLPLATAADGRGFSDRIIRVERPDGDSELIEVELGSPGFLVVREYFMKGWHAEVDGEEAPIYYADGVGRTLFLDAGRHQIRFFFKLPGLFRGGLLSAITAISLAVGAIIYPSLKKRLEK
jgi:hypothetical protein